MPRRRKIKSDRFPYHIVARTNNKERLPLPLERCWKIFCAYLGATTEKYEIQVMSFVLMPNHWHMMALTPNLNLSEAMNFFMRESSKKIGELSGRRNHIFGGRHRPSLITDLNYLRHAYKYIYRNPVDAGLSKTVSDYEFTTWNWVKKGSYFFPLFDERAVAMGNLNPDIETREEWLNLGYTKKQRELIRNGLSHGEFELSKDENFKKARRDLEMEER